MQMGKVGKSLQLETFSVASSASTEKTILREPGPEFIVTAQFSFPPRENSTEVPCMMLLPHPEVQTSRGMCLEISTSMVSLTPSQAVEGTAKFSNWGGWRYGY